MPYPKRSGPVLQATLDVALQCLDCALHLPIGLAIANGDVVVDDA